MTRDNLDDINSRFSEASRQQRTETYEYNYRQRRHPAHGVKAVANQPTIVYVTLVCDKRARWLASAYHHELLVDIWRDSAHWLVGRYMLMPDHMHLFASPQEMSVDLESWVEYFKSQFNKRNAHGKYAWQTDHWDVRMRSQLHYEEKSQYMVNNPVRAGLVERSGDWPYQGILHDLRWD